MASILVKLRRLVSASRMRKFVMIEKLLEKSGLKPAGSGTGKPLPLEVFKSIFGLKGKS